MGESETQQRLPPGGRIASPLERNSASYPPKKRNNDCISHTIEKKRKICYREEVGESVRTNSNDPPGCHGEMGQRQ